MEKQPGKRHLKLVVNNQEVGKPESLSIALARPYVQMGERYTAQGAWLDAVVSFDMAQSYLAGYSGFPPPKPKADNEDGPKLSPEERDLLEYATRQKAVIRLLLSEIGPGRLEPRYEELGSDEAS